MGLLTSLDSGKSDESRIKKPFDPSGDFDLSSLRSRLDLDGGVFIAGHSFGGATVLKAVHEDRRFKERTNELKDG